jgi:hypothetical protein
MAARTKPETETLEDDAIVLEAQERLKRWRDYEGDFPDLYKDDVKFANGDSDNGWQWPRDLFNERTSGTNKRPALTINKVAQKVALIVNDARQNKPSVSIKPIGGETSFVAAEVYEGLVRHIEYISGAQAIYDDCVQSTVEGGISYFRANTRFCDDDTFNQDIVAEPVQNQLGVALDPDIKQKDGSDANWGLIFEAIPRDEAEKDYPELDVSPARVMLGGPETWIREDFVMIAEYYRLKLTDDELIYMEDDQEQGATFFRSDIPAKFRKQVEAAEKVGQVVKKRKVKRKQLEWYKIIGNQIAQRNLELPGPYVPIIRVVGIERVIDGKLHRRGHVRTLKDPQRMYNYNSSGQVESGALGTKTKWVGQKEAFEGNEVAWNNANIQNAAYLTVNGWDAEHDREIPMPVQMAPTQSVPVFLDGMKIAEHEIDMASGQYESQDGRQGNERSGKAIAERQRQGDTSTYHFIDHLALAIRYFGRIIIAWAPHYYDTERVIQIRGRDGVESNVTIKPDLEEAVTTQKEKDVIQVMFNPKKGKYLVESDVGPAYSTQRQEAWNAFVQIITGAPALIDEIGDLMFRSADFPLADKIAERLHNKIKAEKPYLFDDQAPTPMMQQLQAEVKQLTEQTGELMQKLAENRLKLVGKDQKRDIDAFRAFTGRIKDLANAQPELKDIPGQMQLLAQALVETFTQMGAGPDPSDTLQGHTSGDSLRSDDQDADQLGQMPHEQPPVEGARKADDGHWYVQHPETKQHMRVEPLQ